MENIKVFFLCISPILAYILVLVILFALWILFSTLYRITLDADFERAAIEVNIMIIRFLFLL